MLHLLTEEHREKVTREYKKRVIIVFLLGIFVVMLISSAFLLPIFFTSYGRYSEVSIQKDSLDNQAIKTDESSSLSVKNMIASLDAVHTFDSQKSISGIVANIVKSKPSGVQLKGMVFSPVDDSSVTVDIAGRASTRNSLVSFNEKLKQNQTFSQVLVPLSSFAKEKDIDFSMKLFVSSSSAVSADLSSFDTIQDLTLSTTSSTATSTHK